jgi:hypothetical protein
MKLDRRVVGIALCLAIFAAAGVFAADAPQTESPAPAPALSEPVAPAAPVTPAPPLDLGGTVPEPLFLVWPPPTGCPPPPAYPCYSYTDCTGYCGGPGSCYKTGGSNCGKCLCA